VAESRVRDLVGQNFPGSIVAACPRKLNGFQDVYLLERDDAPDRAGGRRLRNVEDTS
jgi:hypothetical protein